MRQVRDVRTLSSCKLRSNEIMTRKAQLGYVYQVKVPILYSTIDDVKVGSSGFATSAGMTQSPHRRGPGCPIDTNALQTDKLGLGQSLPLLSD